MLDQEFKYYLEHQFELVKKYNGKYLVIKGEAIIGVYDTKEEAYFNSQKEHELGTFLIQFCSPGDTSYTQTYHSRVTF
jgi:hypothetical protein